MPLIKKAIILCLFLISLNGIAQINGYAKVTSISGTTFTLSNVNQTYHSFAVGNELIVMQMQGDVIGTNTGDNSSFGNLSAIGSTGLYEVAVITAIDGNTTSGHTAISPANITVSSLNYSYVTGTNSSVQIITHRKMSTTNYTTTANITGLPWDGNIGGVIALQVPGTLTLAHSISANGIGFRGGAKSNNIDPGSCTGTPYRVNNNTYGYKGEGIYKRTDVQYTNARAKLLNGGGGGVAHNSGGGGGGNYTEGGVGGVGYNGGATGCSSTPSYGYGGISLSGVIVTGRIFMGGGGGGGQQNNLQGSDGGNGGGIIFLRANTIVTTTCTNRTISANGSSVSGLSNDGQGGGGAAGSIVLWVNNWSVSSTCPLIVSANGGSGGTSSTGVAHGGGGAGGQGIVIYMNTQPTSNITTTTNNGSAGCNNNSNPCTSSAGSATGTNGQGILTPAANPLSIELVFFNASLLDQYTVALEWQTASERNNDYFTVQRSADGSDWENILTQDGAGNSTTLLNYYDVDTAPLPGISYYRLKQIDFDGMFTYSPIVMISNDQSDVPYPNPADNFVVISVQKQIKPEIFTSLGQNVTDQVDFNLLSDEKVHMNVERLNSGFYIVRCGDMTYPISIIHK